MFKNQRTKYGVCSVIRHLKFKFKLWNSTLNISEGAVKYTYLNVFASKYVSYFAFDVPHKLIIETCI